MTCRFMRSDCSVSSSFQDCWHEHAAATITVFTVYEQDLVAPGAQIIQANPHPSQIQGLSQQLATLFLRFSSRCQLLRHQAKRPLSVFTTPVLGPSAASLRSRAPHNFVRGDHGSWLGPIYWMAHSRSDEVIKSDVSCYGWRLRPVDGSSRRCPTI